MGNKVIYIGEYTLATLVMLQRYMKKSICKSAKEVYSLESKVFTYIAGNKENMQ